VKKFVNKKVLVAVIDVANPQALVKNPLKLGPGPNCLWLTNTAGSAEARNWVAYMTQLDATGACSTDFSAVHQLAASAIPRGGKDETVPPTVRFFDSAADQNNDVPDGATLIGVKCGRLWCEVGTAVYKPPMNDPGDNSQAATVKGWHDEQQLWMHDASGLVPSKVWAKVTPVADIADVTTIDYSNGYRRAVTVFIPPTVSNADLQASGYGDTPNANWPKKKGWRLKPGPNYIGLHYDTPTKTWSASLIDANNSPLNGGMLNVSSYMDHPSIPLPGTTRWYWTDLDDVIWMPCAEGCCTVDSGLQ
jgi:hypothetical protein